MTGAPTHRRAPNRVSGRSIPRSLSSLVNFGRKLAEGTPAEVQRNAAVLEAYLGRAA